jgi:hypothetical protein
MIDNQHDQVRGRRFLDSASNSLGSTELIMAEGHLWSGISVHLTPTKRNRRTKTGANTTTMYMKQGCYHVCRMETTQVCSECQDANIDNILAPEIWICKPTTFRTCFATHMAECHEL